MRRVQGQGKNKTTDSRWRVSALVEQVEKARDKIKMENSLLRGQRSSEMDGKGERVGDVGEWGCGRKGSKGLYVY